MHDLEQWQSLAARNGAMFIGFQDTADGDKVPLFNDDVTHSSFLLLKGETIGQAVERIRRKFGCSTLSK